MLQVLRGMDKVWLDLPNLRPITYDVWSWASTQPGSRSSQYIEVARYILYRTHTQFNAEAMRNDLQDPDSYIVAHLAEKFTWDRKTQDDFFREVTGLAGQLRMQPEASQANNVVDKPKFVDAAVSIPLKPINDALSANYSYSKDTVEDEDVSTPTRYSEHVVKARTVCYHQYRLSGLRDEQHFIKYGWSEKCGIVMDLVRLCSLTDGSTASASLIRHHDS